MTPREWLSILGVLAGLLVGLPAIKACAFRFGSSPEFARKAVHVLMGLICISFPWVFERPQPVWLLAAVATFSLLAVRTVPLLRSGVGSALHGIKRPSYGEVLFAPAVAAVFHLSGGDPIPYGIPIGILTLADAAGALAGTRWGKRHYGCGEGFKSIEGSAVFLFTAFLCVFVPLALGGTTGLATALWIAAILSTLAMIAEGFSDRGFDNLVLPLGSVLVLERLLPLADAALAGRFAVLVLVLALVLTGARWSTLSGAALLGSALLGYGCAIIADWRYALPPCAVFICHVVITRKHRLTKAFDHRLDAVLSHAIACLPWVIGYGLGGLSFGTGLAGISFAMVVQLALLDVATRDAVPHLAPKALRSTLKGGLIAGVPGLVWLAADISKLLLPFAATLIFTLVLANLIKGISRKCEGHATCLWTIQGLLALIGSSPALLYQP